MNKTIRIVVIGIIAYVLCAIQAYISMYEYEGNLSSTLTSSFFSVLFFLLVYSLFLFIRFLNHKAIIPTAIYAVACFMVNHEIFVSKETSWSTFTTSEELIGTLQKSCIAILITTIIFYLIVKKLPMKKQQLS